MGDVVCSLDGFDQLDGDLARFFREIEGEAKRLIADTVLDAELAIADQINAFDAVDTGRLKGSIDGKSSRGRAGRPGYTFDSRDSLTEIGADGLSAVVGTNLAYAIPVHEGYIRKIKGRHRAAKAIRGRKNKRGQVVDKLKLTKRERAQGMTLTEKYQRQMARYEATTQGKLSVRNRGRYAGGAEGNYLQAYGSAADGDSGERFTFLAVTGRAFMKSALPIIAQNFRAEADRRFGRYGFGAV